MSNQCCFIVYNAVVLDDPFWIHESKRAFHEFINKPGWHRKAVKRVEHYVNKAPVKDKGDKKLIADLAAESKHLRAHNFAYALHIGSDASMCFPPPRGRFLFTSFPL